MSLDFTLMRLLLALLVLANFAWYAWHSWVRLPAEAPVAAATEGPRLVLVQNFFEELRRRVPR